MSEHDAEAAQAQAEHEVAQLQRPAPVRELEQEQPRVAPEAESAQRAVVERLRVRDVELTAGERAILVTLARSYPSVAPRPALDHLPWRTAGDVSSNVTEVLVARLRQKLAGASAGVEIRTVRRAGYRLQLSTITTTYP